MNPRAIRGAGLRRLVRRLLRSGIGPALLAAALLLRCAAWAQPPVLHVAAAADLEPVLPGVLAQFEQQTGIHAVADYKSSAVLTQQILNGAPIDIFFAADTGFPQKVVEAGLAVEPEPVPYARGTLVLWARNGQPLMDGRPVTLGVLRNPALASVAIANPGHAPYGHAAQAAITNMHLAALLGPKLRVAANIAEAAQYAESGNAQVGFLSLTSARTPRLAADGTYAVVPAGLYPPLLQAAVVLRHAPDRSAAERLLRFMSEPGVRAYLAQRGLAPPR